MNRRIYKYPVGEGTTGVQLPYGAQIISAGVQVKDGQNQPVIWAIVNAAETRVVVHNIYIVGTGVPFEHSPDDMFIGSFVTPQGRVFHAFAGAVA